MEEIDGKTVADTDGDRGLSDPAKVLASRLLRSFFDQVLRDGLYHGDPHPGNIFVDRQGTLWFLDFGAVGRLDPVILEAMQEMAIGFQLRDPVVLARATSALAGSDDASDSRAARGRHRAWRSRRASAAAGFDPTAMTMILDIMGRHGLTVPTPMTILSRSLLTLEGTLRTIEPSFDVATEVNAAAPRARRAEERGDAAAAREGARPRPSVAAHVARPRRGDRRTTAPWAIEHAARALCRRGSCGRQHDGSTAWSSRRSEWSACSARRCC